MGSEWEDKTLGELLQITSSKRIFRADYCPTGIPFYRSKEIIEKAKGQDISTKLYISSRKFNEIKNKFGAPGYNDILLTSVGTLGIPYLVRNGEQFYFKDGNLTWFRNFSPKLLPLYLHLWFRSSIAKKLIDEITIGSTQQALTIVSLKSLKIKLPPLPEQKAIAHVLGTLDDRIELNRQMNETLEGMAQALFKSWFVDFDPVIDNAMASGRKVPEELGKRAAARAALGNKRKPLPADIRALFPDEFTHTEELGWIPKGWEVVTLHNIIELTGGGTPKTSVDEYWGGDIPWFSVVDAPAPENIFVIDTVKHVTQLGVENSSTKILPIGTTIISARGTVGKCALVGQPMAMNQSCYGIRGKKGIADYFVYYVVRDQVGHLQRGGHGSVFNTVTRDTFKIIKISMGKAQHTQQFGDCIKPFLDQILANNIQNSVLSKLRDTLLPKLLSGELRIPDAEKMVVEAAE